MPSNNYQVYLTTELVRDKYYIGVHRGDIFEDEYYGSGKLIQRVIKKRQDTLEQEVISTFKNKKLAYWLEGCLVGEDVVTDDNSYNLAEGGSAPPMSRYWKGKKHSKEHRRKLTESRKGLVIPRTKEWGDNISKAKKGNPLTKEHRKALSDAKRKTSKYKNILQCDLDGNVIKEWKDAIEIKNLGLYNMSSVYRCIKNERKTADGYKWKLKN